MKIEKATTRLHPITWISIGLNIFFSYYVLNLRLQAQVSSTLPPRTALPSADCSSAVNEALRNIHSGKPVHCPKIKCPLCKCETDEADEHAKKDPLQIHKDDDFDVTKLPVPDVIPEDSADSFVVDIGTYVPPKNTLHENKVRRRPTKPCRDDTRILIGIKTVPEGHNRREAIRKTWGNVTHYENFPAQVIFLLGMDSSSYKQNRAFEKLEKDDDLLVGDFVDSFHNLTYKDSLFLTWMKHECPSATYAFKGDDDTLVNPFELEKLVKEENDRQATLKKPMGSIFGSLLETQPVERHSTKYGDNLWPVHDYPTYVSGGGFLMNRKAAMALQYYIKITPKINIDDAFIGVLMSRAGMGHQLFRDTRFHSWGFKPYYEKQFDVCEIDKVIYFHKFMPKEMNCFWPKFLKSRQFCADPDYKYEEDGELCDRNLWYKSKNLSAPNLEENKLYHRCGPDFNNSVCSVNQADWRIRKPWNGPCCSPGGYCGTTPDHCDCAVGCINFKKMVEKSQLEKENKNGQCCQFIKVESGLTYSGIYRLATDDKTKEPKTSVNGHVEYVRFSSDSKKDDETFSIKFGGFSVHGTGWYILAKAGGGLSWQLKDAATCPPMGDWDGYGAVFSCVAGA